MAAATNVGAIEATISADDSAFTAAIKRVVDKLSSVPGAAAAAQQALAGVGGSAAKAAATLSGGFSAAVQKAAASLNNLGSAAPNFEAIGSKMKDVAERIAVASTVIAASLGKLTIEAIKTASDFNEQSNVIQQSFGSMTPQIDRWAVDTAKAFGRSRGEVREMAGEFQALAVPMLKNRDQAARLSTEMTKLAIDIASFHNLSDTDVMMALKSGLVGMVEPLRRFGITMTEEALQSYAFSKGIKVLVQNMDESSKMALRYQYILANTTDKQGDAIRTADGLANSWRTMKGAVEDLLKAMGDPLMRAATDIVQGVTDLARGIADTNPVTLKWAAYLMGVVAAGSAVVAILAGATAAIIGWKLAAIAASAAGVTLSGTMAAAWAAFAPFVVGLGAFVIAFTATSKVMDAFGLGLPKNVSLIDALAQALDDSLSSWDGFKVAAVNAGLALVETFGVLLKGLSYLAGPGVGEAFSRTWNSAVEGVRERLQELVASTDDAKKAAAALGGQSLVGGGGGGASAAAAAADAAGKIGLEPKVTGLVDAKKAMEDLKAATTKSTEALQKWVEIQKEAASAAVVGRVEESFRGQAQVFADFDKKAREATKAFTEFNKHAIESQKHFADLQKTAPALAAALPKEQRPQQALSKGVLQKTTADLLEGTIDNLRKNLESVPFRDFADTMSRTIAELRERGGTPEEIARLQRTTIVPVNPAEKPLADARAQLEDLRGTSESFADLAKITRDATTAMGELAESLIKDGAKIQDVQNLMVLQQQIAVEKVVKAFNDGATNLDAFNKGLPAVADAMAKLGGSIDDVRARLRANPQNLADLLSGGVGDSLDKLTGSLNLTGQDRSKVVGDFADAFAGAITNQKIDMGPISDALGRLIGSSSKGADFISKAFPGAASQFTAPLQAAGDVLSDAAPAIPGLGAGVDFGSLAAGAGAGGTAGLTAGPAGAAIGAAIGGIIATAAPIVLNAIESLSSTISNAAKGIASIVGDKRLTDAVGDAVNADMGMVAAFGAVAAAALLLLSPINAGVVATLALVAALGVAMGALVLLATPVGALIAAFASLVVWVGLVGVFFALVANTKSFQRFEDAFAKVVDHLERAIEPFMENLMPLAGLFEALANEIIPLFQSFANSAGLASVFFDVVKGLAIVFGALTLAGAYLESAILAVVIGIASALQGFLTSMKSVLSNVGLGGVIPQQLIDGLGGIAKTANQMSPDLQKMGKAFTDLTNLTESDAKIRGDILAKERDISESLTNVPEGFKVVAARFRSITAQTNLNGAIDSTDIAVGTLAPPKGQNFYIQELHVEAADPAALSQALQAAAERQSLQQTGTTQTKGGQNTGH